ncbi:MAG: LamG domain-containing protein, partial [Pseudomonadales bacterium]|nr:LamG domain-containing protein [Pseudomonadales bacterium]
MLRSLSIDALSGIGCCVGLAILLSLGGCGGNSGADTQTRPDTTVPQNNQYTGPAPATDDVQRFKLFVWDNLAPSNRCGQCHSETQAPLFVARADINQAYSEANAVTNLDNPSDSIMVRKVAGGHNCWLDSDAACADTLSRYLEAWASESVGKEAVIELTRPPVLEIGSAKQFSDSNQGFAETVYPILQNFCAQCHSRSAAIPQAPFFADPDIDIAYSEAQAKIDLTTPDNSRVVIRLRDEFHNCWSECEQNAAQLTAAISDLSETLPEITFDQTLLTSKALTLEHGILASSGGRFQENAVALYEFKTGEGTTVFDTSGVEPALNLTLSGDTEWVAGWGITLNGGKAQGTTLSSRKLQNSIAATGEYSIETWLASATTTQEGPARIVSYSAGLNARNFTLGQLQQNYTFSLRHANTDANGAPALTTPDASTALQATLQHVVATYSPAYGRRIYVNGELVSDPDATIPGNLNDWDNTYA